MDIGNNELAKSLVDLIDETLDEIEELKKSSKFAASEVKIAGPGTDAIAGAPTDGKLDAKKADDDDKDDDDKDKDKDVDKDKDMEKADVAKAMEKMDDMDKAEMYKMYMDNKSKMDKGENEKANPGGADYSDKSGGKNHGNMDKSNEPESAPIQKQEASKEDEGLIKSYVDGRISSLENKFSEVADLVKKLGEQPTERKSVAAGAQVDALKKSIDEVEPLSKSEIASKLFELKKSGTYVDSAHIAQAETGSLTDARELAAKYDIK